MMFGEANPYNLECPSREMLTVIGGKWAILLICALRQRTMRTGELKRTVGGISQKMLIQTLKSWRIALQARLTPTTGWMIWVRRPASKGHAIASWGLAWRSAQRTMRA